MRPSQKSKTCMKSVPLLDEHPNPTGLRLKGQDPHRVCKQFLSRKLRGVFVHLEWLVPDRKFADFGLWPHSPSSLCFSTK